MPASVKPDDAAGHSGPQAIDGVLTISASERAQVFMSQPEVLQQRHGSPIVVTGVVQDIQPNRVQHYPTMPSLSFDHKWTLQTDEFGPEAGAPLVILCDCADHPTEEQSRQTLAGIRPGQTVTVSGILWYTGPKATFINVRHASITDSQPAPENAPPAEPLVPEAELQQFLAGYTAGQAALDACNEPFSEAWTEEGTLKADIVDGLQKLPIIEELWVTQPVSADGLRQLAALESIRALTISAFRQDVTTDEFGALANVRFLKSLELRRTPANLLPALSQFPALQSLTINKRIGEKQALAPIGSLEPLQELTAVFVADVDLAAFQSLDQIRSLKLSASSVTGAGLKGLAGHQLISLELEDCPLTASDSAELGSFSELKRLVVNVTGAKSVELGNLAFLSTLPHLQVLRLRGSVEPGCGEHLAGLENLQSFVIESSGFTDPECTAFASTGKPYLKVIKLQNSPVGDEAVAALFKQPLTQLIELDLSGTQVGDHALKALTAGARPSLEAIHLNGTKVTDSGIAYLKGLPTLRFIHARDTAVTEGAIDGVLNEP